jgi:hypothetical protein
MRDLKHTLADLAERGTPIGADRLRDRVMLDLAPGSSPTSWARVDTHRPAFVIAAAVVATLLVVGAVPLLFGWMGSFGSETATATSVSEPQVAPPVVGVGDGQTVSVTVSDVSGYANYELAGVLYAGGDLTDLDRDAVGGFWSVVDGDPFTTTEVVREPGEEGVGWFPYVTDQALAVTPDTYTLVVWVDTGLGPVSRWVPLNSDGAGLHGCQTVFDVGDAAQTDIIVPANLVSNGWNTDCTTGIPIPGTDADTAVTPPDDPEA